MWSGCNPPFEKSAYGPVTGAAFPLSKRASIFEQLCLIMHIQEINCWKMHAHAQYDRTRVEGGYWDGNTVELRWN